MKRSLLLAVKLAVASAAAILYFALLNGEVVPGQELRLASIALGIVPGGIGQAVFPLWSKLIVMAGASVRAMSFVSAITAAIDVYLIATIFGDVLSWSAGRAMATGADEHEARYRKAVVFGAVLTAAAFALTPWVFRAATQVSPLMTELVMPLAMAACAQRIFFADFCPVVERVKLHKLAVLMFLLLVCLVINELGHGGWRIVGRLAMWPLVGFFVVGILPALLTARAIGRHGPAKVGWSRRYKAWGGVIAVLLVAMVVMRVTSKPTATNRLVGQIIAEAKGKVAIVNEGALDDVFAFMLPKEIRAISLAREHDPEYGRLLAQWAREEVEVKGGGGEGEVEVKGGGGEEAEKMREELAFAAEQGARALLDEWKKRDEKGFKESVLLSRGYFPTLEKWRTAVATYGEIGERESLKGYFRRLLGVVGNDFGCEQLERGATNEAWQVFYEVVDKVDDDNYSALVNLTQIAEGGYRAETYQLARVKTLKTDCERFLKTQERAIRAIQASGRAYVDPAKKAEFESRRREAIEKHGLSPKAQEFLETLKAAKNGPKEGIKAREAIRKALERGEIKIEDFGGELIHLDIALGDIKSAENDAHRVIKFDRSNPLANEVLASLCLNRGDVAAAERYLRRSVESGGASLLGKNNFAMVLTKLGKATEAEPYAREVVAAMPDEWNFRDTLARVLRAEGKTDEAEKELAIARELAKKAGQLKEFEKAVGK